MTRHTYPCNSIKAAYVKWAVLDRGWTLTQAAIVVGLNVGTVSHVIHGRRFASVAAMPIPGHT